MRSSGCSRPTDRRTRLSVMPSSARSAGGEALGDGGGVGEQRLGATERQGDAREAAPLDHGDGVVGGAVDLEGDDGAAAGHLPLGEVVLGMALEVRVGDATRSGGAPRGPRRWRGPRRTGVGSGPAACGCPASRSTRRTVTPGCRGPTGRPRSARSGQRCQPRPRAGCRCGRRCPWWRRAAPGRRHGRAGAAPRARRRSSRRP